MSAYAILIYAGKPIFSIDIHPDDSRFATGGQGNRSWCFIVMQMQIIFVINYVIYNSFHIHELITAAVMTTAIAYFSGFQDFK
jgi:hypothetical protein